MCSVKGKISGGMGKLGGVRAFPVCEGTGKPVLAHGTHRSTSSTALSEVIHT
jgi:hypothetical protein